MADKRAFAKFDIGYLDNPKMMDVLDCSLNAICMHFASVLYCSQHLTDGLVAPGAMQRKIGGAAADTQILVDAGLWHLPGHDCESCHEACPEIPPNRVYVHDFLEHNRDAAAAKRVSQRRSEAAKSRWAKEKADEPDTKTADANCIQDALQKKDVCNAEREREKERDLKEEPPESDDSTATPRADVQAIIDSMTEALDANDVRYNIGKTWHDAARLLIDKDRYTVDQIRYVIQYATTSAFWKPNVLSVPKLRQKFETLKLQAIDKGKAGNGKPTTMDRVAQTAEMGARLQQQQDQLQIGIDP